MLGLSSKVKHPVMLNDAQIEQARKNIESTEWGRKWYEKQKTRANLIVSQPPGYVERMISKLTPGYRLGFTCPNCVGTKSQEGAGKRLIGWDYRNPDSIMCEVCGHKYPDEKYPESAVLDCPRMGQQFTYYLNPAEQAHPEDRSGQYAYRWVGRRVHMSFSGTARQFRNYFMFDSLEPLAYCYVLTGEPRYAQRAIEILVRLADCYRGWLYHDYFGGIADCDPLYAAWHDKELRLEWKKHLTEQTYKDDTAEKA